MIEYFVVINENEYLIHLNFRAPLIFAQTCAKINGSENKTQIFCAKINGSNKIGPRIYVFAKEMDKKRSKLTIFIYLMAIERVKH